MPKNALGELWRGPVCCAANKITANASFGKYHEIEVEDDVTAFLEYPNGATGVFIATTGGAQMAWMSHPFEPSSAGMIAFVLARSIFFYNRIPGHQSV